MKMNTVTVNVREGRYIILFQRSSVGSSVFLKSRSLSDPSRFFLLSLSVHKWTTNPIKIFYRLTTMLLNISVPVLGSLWQLASLLAQSPADFPHSSPQCSGKVRFVRSVLCWLTTEWHKDFLLGYSVCVGAPLRVSSKFLLWSDLSMCSEVSWALDTSDETSHSWVLQLYELEGDSFGTWLYKRMPLDH